MKVIAVLGRKGGGGKTACSHLLSLSFGLAGYLIGASKRHKYTPCKGIFFRG